MIWGPAWLMGYLWDEMASATVPATWGAAILVPDFVPYLFPGSVEYMFTPGAQSSTFGPLQLKAARLLLSMAETAMMLLYLAGYETGPPLQLPAAATRIIPRLYAASMILPITVGALEAPRLMLTTSILCLMHHSMPARK